jgi:hypothetical protein
VTGRTVLRRAAPWVLCAVGATLMGLAVFVQIVNSGASVEETLTFSAETLGLVSFPLVGAVIAARLPANPYGWVWCALGIAVGVLDLTAALAEGRTATGYLNDVVAYFSYLALVGLLVFVFLLFPTGRLPSRRWRWVVRATVVLGLLLAVATPFAPTALDPSPGPWEPSGAPGRLLADLIAAATGVMFLLVVIAVASLIPRFPPAAPLDRLQKKRFLHAAVVNAVYLVLDLVVGLPVGGIWVLVAVLVPNLIPVAIGLAVLRYRLYEIDRIVSRTVSYGLLSAALIGLYLGVVALLRPVLDPLTGSSSLAVAASTLAVAAAFNPARRRLQAMVDRRFDRARYDAARAVQAFAARLRTQVDLDEVTEGLRETVSATVAPTRVAVWLRVPSGTGGS